MHSKWQGNILEIKENLSKVIGKTYKGFIILEVMDSFDGKEVKRICKCQCPCGTIVYKSSLKFYMERMLKNIVVHKKEML